MQCEYCKYTKVEGITCADCNASVVSVVGQQDADDLLSAISIAISHCPKDSPNLKKALKRIRKSLLAQYRYQFAKT